MSHSYSQRSHTWQSQVFHVGDIEVLRPFPSALAQSIGPFVFLDHFGPIAAPGGKLPAHPHAGIEVVTYLIDGANEHTDSLGNVGRIGAGGAQWMRAGSGVIHAERNLLELADTMHGIQLWARLPVSRQDCPPDYEAIQAQDVPTWKSGEAELRLLSGQFEGRVGPIPFALSAFALHVSLSGSDVLEIELPSSEHEYGVYGIAGKSVIFDTVAETLSTGTMHRIARTTRTVSVSGSGGSEADILIIGGEPAPTPLHFGGPFVFDTREAILDAERRFREGEMGTLDGVPF